MSSGQKACAEDAAERRYRDRVEKLERITRSKALTEALFENINIIYGVLDSVNLENVPMTARQHLLVERLKKAVRELP